MTNQEFNTLIEPALQKAKKYILSKFQINEFDLNDILQNSAIKAFKNLSQFQGKSSFETWFICIARNETNNFFSKKKIEQVEITESLVCSSGEDPLLKDYSSLVYGAVSELNEKNKQIINFFLDGSASSSEISELLKIPVSSVRTRLFYAKKKLKEIIVKKCKEESYSHISFTN